MKLQFDKNVCRNLQILTRENREQELTQEIRLPDGFPDLGTVLGCWGQVILGSKEWHSDGMRVTGGIMVWVLYQPEDESGPQCADSWIPFETRWDFPKTEQEGKIRVNCTVKNTDARVVSSRKMMARVQLAVCGEALVQQDSEIYSPASEEDMQLLRNHYPVRLAVEAGEKCYPLEEDLTLPSSCPPVHRIFRYDLQTELQEWKIMGTKLVFRGSANLHILYGSEDGQIQCWDFEVPFSQYTELETSCGEEDQADISLQLTGLECRLNDDGTLQLKSSLVSQYVIYQTRLLEIVQDGYCLHRSLEPEGVTLTLPEILENVQYTVPALQQIPVDGNRIADVSFVPGLSRQMQAGDGVNVSYTGQFQLLYYDREGVLCSSRADWTEETEILADAEGKMYVDCSASGRPQISISGGNLQVRNDLKVVRKTFGTKGIPMITAVEIGELSEEKRTGPSLILRRAGEESLWEMAKKSGSTVEAIRRANALQQEPVRGQILLIPVS